MPQQYEVSAVAATREEWGWLVLLGDIENMDGSPYLMLQLAHDFTDDDKRLGQDQPYIEINNQGWSWYGHIERLELGRDQVAVQMDRKAQERMENDGQFVFRFRLAEPEFSRLEQVLSSNFALAMPFTSAA